MNIQRRSCWMSVVQMVFFSQLAEEDGFDCWGVEVSAWAVKHAQQRLSNKTTEYFAVR